MISRGRQIHDLYCRQTRINHFREFLGGQDIAFSDITVGMIEKLKVYLKRPNKDDLIFPELKKLDTLENEFNVKKQISFAMSDIDKCLLSCHARYDRCKCPV